MAALALLTSVLGVQAQGYQDYRDHNYGSRRDYSMYANRYDRFGIDGVYMGIRIGPSSPTTRRSTAAIRRPVSTSACSAVCSSRRRLRCSSRAD